MPNNEDKKQYQTRYGTFYDTGNNISQNSVLLADNVDAEGQLTNLRVYATENVQLQVSSDQLDNGEDAVPFDQQNASTAGSPTPKLHLVGQSSYEVGDFENPAAEVGARNKIEITILNDPSDSASFAINARIDEHLG